MHWWRAGWLAGMLAASACGGRSSSHEGHPAQGGSGGAGVGGSSTASGLGGGSGATSANESWVVQRSDTFGAVAFGIGVDSNDDALVLVAYLVGLSEPARHMLEKVDRTGNVLWSAPIAQSGPQLLAVTPEGTAVVAGIVLQTDSTGMRNDDIAVSGYDASGNTRFDITFGSDGLDDVLAVNIQRLGYIYVLWTSRTSSGDSEIYLSELREDGRVLGAAPVQAPEPVVPTVIDRDANVVTTEGTADYSLRKSDAQGNELWTTPVPSAPSWLATDDLGTTLVLGPVLTTPRYVLTGLDTAGRERFSTEFGDEAETPSVAALDLFLRAFTVSTVTSDQGATWDVLVRHFDVDGTVLATRSLGTEQRDTPLAAACDSKGALLIAGVTGGAFEGHENPSGSDAFIARIAP